MTNMRALITLVESAGTAQALDEAVNTREMVFYHGTKSGAFDRFDPALAAKGSQHWNPLGTALYATNQIQYARAYGTPHKIVIPPGYKYKRVTLKEWGLLGYKLIMRGLEKALARHGKTEADWQHGDPDPTWMAPTPEKIRMTGPIDTLRATLVDLACRVHPDKSREEMAAAVAARPDEKIKGYIKYYAKLLKPDMTPPRIPNPERRENWERFRFYIVRVTRQDSPRDSFSEAYGLVEQTFGEDIAETFKDTLTQESDKFFGKYDFVIFTESEDSAGYEGRGGKIEGSYEVLIFNPDLQKIVAMDDQGL